MQNVVKIVTSMVFAMFLLACSEAGQPTIDMSSTEEFEASLQTVMSSLEEEERQETFSEAISAIMMDEMTDGMSEEKSEEEIEAAIHERLHGKTADEIIAQFEE